jgi:hypothetical protein
MHGALINLSANLTGLSWPLLPVGFNNEVFDTDGIFNPAVPGVFRVPAGFSYARLTCGVYLPPSSNAGSMHLSIRKNADQSPANGVNAVRNSNTGYTDNGQTSIVAWIPVVEDDEFFVRLNVSGIGSPTSILQHDSTFFQIELSN